MMKVYIEKKNSMSRIYEIKRYDDDSVIHSYFTDEKQARDFIKELRLNYTIVKKKKARDDMIEYLY